MNTKTFATLKKEFKLTSEEINYLESLPENLPENKLTSKQRKEVSRLYHHYIENKIYKGWGQDLAEFEQKSEKWPSGPRVKRHEAQRMILGHLVFLSQNKSELTAEQAAKMFYNSMTCRESYVILLSKVYELAP